MDSSRFDELTKALARATSRRQALKTLAATVLGGMLDLGGIGTAFANCKPNDIGCNTNSQCCSGGCCHGTCTDLNTTSNCGRCGNTCTGTTPACCSGACTDLSTDPNNCGSCRHVCRADETCQSGQCAPCKGLQQACTSPGQCCDTGQGKTICAPTKGGGGRCCNEPGGSCSSPYDCCGSQACSNGTCQCTRSGGDCVFDFECCSGVCSNGECSSSNGRHQ